ncbi:MAG: radical SAM protein, partial [Clostridia bacterium]|nr:radical SAM protein [Clostridia bacterium]
PWHPAFSELCQSQIMLNEVLSQINEKGNYIIYVGKSDVSKMTGQKRSNVLHLEAKGIYCKVKPDDTLGNLEVRIEREV